MNYSYPKQEKLKSRTLIQQLFTEGNSVAKYPLRLVYAKTSLEEGLSLQIGVSVSKKYFKKAVDRNYYKRLLRECLRHHKSILTHQTVGETYAFMLLYQTKDRLTHAEVNKLTQQLFEKFNTAVHKKESL